MNSDRGSMADYGLHQAMALKAAGAEVVFLCSQEYIHREKVGGLEAEFALAPQRPGKTALVSKLHGDISALCCLAKKIKPDAILFAAYYEYLAPLWAWELRRLKKKLPMKIASVIHDPIRDFQVGPKWWHEWSIAEAYSFLDYAFLHEDEKIPFSKEKTSVIPHGLYPVKKSQYNRTELRKRFNIPQDAFLILSFGFIRDGKNLDLLIKSLKKIPDAYLIIAGREQSRTQKPIAFYQDLAKSEGVSDRCLWHNRFITADEFGDFFEVSDIVALTYSREFRSASGVLNSTILFQRPVIASGGKSNLQNVVKNYQLGVWVDPDSCEAIIQGIKNFRESSVIPDYDRYIQENSWKKNAKIVIDKLKVKKKQKP